MSEPREVWDFASFDTEAEADAFYRGVLLCGGAPDPGGPFLNSENLWQVTYAYPGGQPPSDGMPTEPSEEAIDAAEQVFIEAIATAPLSRRPSDVEIARHHSRSALTGATIRAALRAAYAAERGVSAVPPTEEP